MAQYMVEAQHTPEECLATLDELSAQGPQALQQWRFGCAAGDHSNHTAYANVEAPDLEAARVMAGNAGGANAHVTEVAPLTQEQIRSFHQAA